MFPDCEKLAVSVKTAQVFLCAEVRIYFVSILFIKRIFEIFDLLMPLLYNKESCYLLGDLNDCD